jgi:hypothetical protein
MHPDVFKSNFAIQDYKRNSVPFKPFVPNKERTYIMIKPDGV